MITYDTLLCFTMIWSSTVVVFASSKGPINYMKVFVSNKKIENPVLPNKRVVSTNPAIEADQGTPTRMTFRDVYMYQATDNNGNIHVTGNYDKRIVGNDKTVTRRPVDEALVQRVCLDIASEVHRQFSEQTVGAAISDITSGTTSHRKSEQQQKKQQQQKQKQEQQKQEHQLQQKKQQQQQKEQQQYKQQQQHKEQQQQQHKQQKQQPQQKPHKRRRNSYQKVSQRPVRYNERKESAGIVTIGPDDRYNDQPVTKEISWTDYPTTVGVAEEDMDDNRQDEDVDQSPKVWEVNMVDDQVIINSAKSQNQRSEAFTPAAATTSAADYDEGNQTS